MMDKSKFLELLNFYHNPENIRKGLWKIAQSWINIYEINSDIIIKILEAFKHRALKNSNITLNQRKKQLDEILENTNYFLITVNGKELSYEIKNVFEK